MRLAPVAIALSVLVLATSACAPSRPHYGIEDPVTYRVEFSSEDEQMFVRLKGTDDVPYVYDENASSQWSVEWVGDGATRFQAQAQSGNTYNPVSCSMYVDGELVGHVDDAVSVYGAICNFH